MKNIYPLQEKIITFIDTLIDDIDLGREIVFPQILELENFAVVDFNYVSYFVEISHHPQESWRKYKIFLIDKKVFRREIYTDKSLQVIKNEFEKLTDLNYILLTLAKEEIFYYYENPLSFIDFYQKYDTLKSNVNYNALLNVPDERTNFFVKLFSSYEDVSNCFIDDYLEKKNTHSLTKSVRKRDYSLGNFVNNSDFITNLVVYIFHTYEQRSTSRRDYWSTETEYCLFYKGVRVHDEYIDSLLPKSFIESFDDYNDSTPGLVRKKVTSFKISYLETEKFHKKYCFDDHIIYLSPKLNIKDYPMGKVEKQTVFHEFGHIVGWELANILGYNFGEIIEINLDSKKGLPSIKTDNFLFKFRKYQNIEELIDIDTNSANKDFKLLEINRIKLNLNCDKKRVLAYMVYLLSGGIFNLYYFKIKPKYKDFNDLFIDDIELEKFGDFTAKAGNDFSKILNFRNDLEWGEYNSNNFKFFAMELFNLLDFHFIFKKLTSHHFDDENKSSTKLSILEDFEIQANGNKITDVTEIQKIRNNINQLLSKEIMFKTELKLLFNKYNNDISKLS